MGLCCLGSMLVYLFVIFFIVYIYICKICFLMFEADNGVMGVVVAIYIYEYIDIHDVVDDNGYGISQIGPPNWLQAQPSRPKGKPGTFPWKAWFAWLSEGIL